MRYIASLVLTLLIGVGTHAQNFKLEFIGGLNFSKPNRTTINFNPQLGCQLGVMKSLMANGKFGLKSGLIFINRNFNAPEAVHYFGLGFSGTVYVDNKFSLNYLQIPILGYYEFNGINISIGGFIENLFQGKAQYFEGTYEEPLDWDHQIKTARYAYGISMGIQYKFKKISAGIDFDNHLNDLSGEIKSIYGQNRIRSLNFVVFFVVSYFL